MQFVHLSYAWVVGKRGVQAMLQVSSIKKQAILASIQNKQCRPISRTSYARQIPEKSML